MSVINHVDVFVNEIDSFDSAIEFIGRAGEYISFRIGFRTTLYFSKKSDLRAFIKIIQTGIKSVK